MEQLINGYLLDTPPGAFPLSTDSILLQDFVRLPRSARVLDLGSGCGTLGLFLCAKDESCHIIGIELDAAAHRAALENIRRNDLSFRMESICADLRHLSEVFSPGSFHCCVSNPPYFTGGAASKATPMARQDSCCHLDDLFQAAAYVIKYGGDFFLVHKPERLSELICCGQTYALEAKRLRLIRHRPGAPISLILLQFRKGGKPGLIWEEETLFDSQGQPTPYYRTLYHLP